MCSGAHVWVKGQLLEVRSLLLPHAFQGIDSIVRLGSKHEDPVYLRHPENLFFLQYFFLFFLKMYSFIMYSMFRLHVCLPPRRGHQISLQMVVSLTVVAGS